MSDEEARRRLAGLIVEALEVGTGKRERDVIDELFDSLGVDFAALERQFTGRSTTLLRESAAERLADAAPTMAVLLNTVVRCGGRFVAMVEAIYKRLARHTATTTGTNETFRLRRANVEEDQLTISPAFLEQVRHLTRTLTTIKIGHIDLDSVQSFVGWDTGVLYGTWPPATANGTRLTDRILALGWIAPAVADRAAGSAAWAEAAEAVAVATRAAEGVISSAEWLVRGYFTYLSSLDDKGGAIRASDVFTIEISDWFARQLEHQIRNDVNRFRDARILAAEVYPRNVTGIDEPTLLGLDEQLRPVRMSAPDRHRNGTTMGTLAGFVAQWRGSHWSRRSRESLEPTLFADQENLTQWLNAITSQCDAAARWLAAEVVHPAVSIDVTTLLESVEEFLNLPLWRQRDLLYEVWVLCATLDACEHAGWRVRLAGTADAEGVGVVGRGDEHAGCSAAGAVTVADVPRGVA
ncbi:hypothetical protein ACFQHO_09620 [Actinomadura yumaensis]|uniref:hypothetical protein n=1 Tax=Actinomadura yumaensis TaxID=111807 RepID=UPI003612D9A1